jgi:two-component system chemotaxis response regulator CheY
MSILPHPSQHLQAGVLIVEDQAHTRQVVRTVLKHIGVKDITEAQDGLAALKILHERNSPRPGTAASNLAPVDIVICDWNMPTMTGVELLRAVRKDSALAEIPFCMLTGENERYSIMEAIEHGANEYIIKPFSTKTLEDKLRTILETLATKKQNGTIG